MKLKHSLLIIAVLAVGNALSQPVCDEATYKAQHGTYQRINELIDQSCVSINAKNYPEAERLLSQAVHLDSIQSNGNPNAFLVEELNKLRAYTGINENETSSREKSSFFGKKKKKEGSDTAPKQEEKTVVKEESKPADTGEQKEKKSFFGKKKENESVNNPVAAAPAETSKQETPVKEAPVTQPPATPAKIETQKKTPEPVKPAPAENVTPVAEAKPSAKPALPPGEKSFTSEQLKEFQDKGLQKVKQLEGHIQIIANKTTRLEISTQAIENALRLFDRPEERLVEVSSLSRPEKVNLFVKKYLEKLRQLNYDNVQIEWADFQYTSDFKKGDDGFYHGYIIFRQRFTASKDDRPVYTDLTTKRTEIILKFYSKAVEGIETENYDVFLGDISVEQTQKN